MSGQAHRAYDAETESIPLEALLADVDGWKAMRVRLPYGTLYLRRSGQRGPYDGLLVGRGGGFVWHEPVKPRIARSLAELGVENGGDVELGRDLWPSKWDGDPR